MEWAVEVEDMTVAYTTKPVLWDVDMKVPIGSLAAIVGPNGAGKSTLLKAMLGLLTVISGSVKFLYRPPPCNGQKGLQENRLCPSKR